MIHPATEVSTGAVAIQMSCPDCERLIVAQMFLEDGEDSAKLPKDISQVLEAMIGVSKHYCFNGRTQCDCGKMVMSCLTVSAHGAGMLTR